MSGSQFKHRGGPFKSIYCHFPRKSLSISISCSFFTFFGFQLRASPGCANHELLSFFHKICYLYQYSGSKAKSYYSSLRRNSFSSHTARDISPANFLSSATADLYSSIESLVVQSYSRPAISRIMPSIGQ